MGENANNEAKNGKSGSYLITFSYGGRYQEFRINVRERKVAPAYLNYSSELINTYNSDNAQIDFENKVQPYLTKESGNIYWIQDNLINAPAKGKIKYGFGIKMILNNAGSKSYWNKGVHFTSSGGKDVFACLPGEVTFVGETTHSGKIIIIDHGAGLKSMYMHLSDTAKKMLATLYFLVRGLPWIYQGQELGMENISVSSIEEVDDISSIDSYKVSLAAGLTEAEALRLIEKNGRDNARTPYQWSSAPGAGFTTGTPWLRVNPNYKTINLEDEKKDPGSVYHYYKKLIALRKDPAWKETLVYGELVPWLADTHNVMAYTRESVEGKILVIANYQTGPRRLPLPAPAERVLLNNYETADLDGQEVLLQGYQVLVLALSPDSQT